MPISLAKAAAIAAVGAIVIAGIALAVRASTKSAGWQNEEVLEIKRNDSNFIESMVVHRVVEGR